MTDETTTPEAGDDFAPDLKLSVLGPEVAQLRTVAIGAAGLPKILIELTRGEDGETPTIEVTAGGFEASVDGIGEIGAILESLGQEIKDETERQRAGTSDAEVSGA